MPEKGLLTWIYFSSDQVPDCPVFTRAKNSLPSWDKYFMPHHKRRIAVDITITPRGHPVPNIVRNVAGKS